MLTKQEAMQKVELVKNAGMQNAGMQNLVLPNDAAVPLNANGIDAIPMHGTTTLKVTKHIANVAVKKSSKTSKKKHIEALLHAMMLEVHCHTAADVSFALACDVYMQSIAQNEE